MRYLITKTLRNKGIGIILIFFLGPVGLFYASVRAALVMIFIVPIALFIVALLLVAMELKIAMGTLIISALILYYPTLYILAISAINKHNRQIIAEGEPFISLPQNNFQNTDTISDKLSVQINEAYSNLEKIKHLYDQKIITEESYIKQNTFLLKSIETLTYNRNALNTPTQQNIVYNHAYSAQVKHERNSNFWIWVLTILLLLSLLYLIYDKESNSFKLDKIINIFSSHSKDKEEIKKKIENTYFGIVNGAYTATTVSGIGPEGLPFYNQNATTLFAMGLAPFAQFFGGLKVEPQNINIYNFQDDNTAQVKYDLIVTSNSSTDTAHIDMVVKKIGGYWKLDGEAFLGNKNQIFKKENLNKRNKSEDVKTLYEISPEFFTAFENRYSKYEQIKDVETINSLLTANLKEKLTNSNVSIQDQYEFFKIKTVSYNSFIIQFFAYRFDGIEISTTVQMNVCDKDGQLIDSKKVAEDSYNQDVDNYYDIANCILYDNGQLVIRRKSRQGTTSKEKIKTEQYFINTNGKISKT